MAAALARTSASVTAEPYASQLFHPIGGCGASNCCAEPVYPPSINPAPHPKSTTIARIFIAKQITIRHIG